MAFKNTEKNKNSDYFVKAQLIKDNEFIISVYHGQTAIEASVVTGINNSLIETRNKAQEYNCDYEFGNFHRK
tara:strand:+ start:314 stop:529 length:216 start_codon:yes stop_codon:yes gene_type:complete